MKIAFKPIEKEKIAHKVKELLGLKPDENIIDKCQGSIGNALKMQDKSEMYSKIDLLLEKIENSDLISVLNNSQILYDEKESIKEILKYIIVYLSKSKQLRKLNCIEYVEQAKRRINANSNYDMCIDYLLMNMHKEINFKN